MPECVTRGMRETRQHELPHGGARSRDPRLTSIILIVVNAIVWLGMRITNSYDGPSTSRSP
ncbi:hypothetical protein [Tessaracoccus coleopterorum]|uniref:hypothetical protein n=1 Tax=Tessaracoccus coleopterorum TaxID=2714950 RepID=UPI001E65009F|nr:hypothetical protein [Tessaracoccus coleopterorum]